MTGGLDFHSDKGLLLPNLTSVKKKGNKAKKGDESHVPVPIHPYYQYQLTRFLSVLSSNTEIGDRELQRQRLRL